MCFGLVGLDFNKTVAFGDTVELRLSSGSKPILLMKKAGLRGSLLREPLPLIILSLAQLSLRGASRPELGVTS